MELKKRVQLLNWVLLLVISFIYFFANLQKVIVPGSTFDEIQRLFKLDAAQVTWVSASFMISYSLMQLLTGLLADRYSGARVISFGGVIFVLGGLMSTMESSLGLFYFSRALTGIGAATVYLSAVKEIARIAPDSMPVVIGLLMIVGYSGCMIGTSPFIEGVRAFGYDTMMLAAAILAFAVYVLYWIMVVFVPLPGVRRDVRFSPGAYRAVLSKGGNVIQLVAIGISFGTYFAMQTVFGKKYLEDYCGLSATHAGLVLTVMMVFASFNSLAMAFLMKLLGNRRLPILRMAGYGCFLCSLALTLLVWLDCRVAWLSIVPMVLSAIVGNVGAISVAAFKDMNEEHRFGTIMSVSNCFAYLVTACLGGTLGKIMDIFPPSLSGDVKVYERESYLLVFGALLVLTSVSAVLSCFLKETNPLLVNRKSA